MKRLLHVFVSILAMSYAFGASSEEEFKGEWINTDTQGIPRIVIRKGGDVWKIHAWGRCTPDPCDWGETTLHLIGDSVGAKEFKRGFAKWEKDFADHFLLIRFEGTGSDYYTKEINGEKIPVRADVPQILVETIALFKDKNGRSNYRKVSLLHKRQAGQPLRTNEQSTISENEIEKQYDRLIEIDHKVYEGMLSDYNKLKAKEDSGQITDKELKLLSHYSDWIKKQPKKIEAHKKLKELSVKRRKVGERIEKEMANVLEEHQKELENRWRKIGKAEPEHYMVEVHEVLKWSEEERNKIVKKYEEGFEQIDKERDEIIKGLRKSN